MITANTVLITAITMSQVTTELLAFIILPRSRSWVFRQPLRSFAYGGKRRATVRYELADRGLQLLFY